MGSEKEQDGAYRAVGTGDNGAIGTEASGADSREGGRAIHVDLAAALASGPPPAGNLAMPIFAHGSLTVEMYQPRGVDRQTPHARDEVYVVARGKGHFFDGERRHAVAEGSFLFVAAGREHRFEDFSEDFAVWVFFYGPAGGESPEHTP